MTYENEILYIEADIDGKSRWAWPRADTNNVFGTLVRDWTKHHKRAFLEHTKNRREVVIQAGGNCGIYPAMLGCYFDRVYTFEPDDLNFFCLTMNCQYPNIIKLQAALGLIGGMGNVARVSPSNIGAHKVYRATPHVPIIPIDSIYLDRCDFIQLDVEGSELDVLRGAERTILRNYPVVSVERTNLEIERFLGGYHYKAAETVLEDTIYVPG